MFGDGGAHIKVENKIEERDMANASEDLVPFTYIWAIEDYPQLSTETGVLSPNFTVDSMEGTQWCLVVQALYYMDLFECALWRLEDNGPRSIEIEFELSILDANGEALIEMKKTNVFKKHSCDRVSAFQYIDNFPERRTEFLPKNTATLRCRMWRTEVKVSESTLCFARTRLGTEYASLFWPIEDFAALEPYEKRPVTLKFALKGFDLCLELAIISTDEKREYIWLKAIKCEATKEFHLSWVITFVGADGKKHILVKGHKYLGDQVKNKVLGKLFAKETLRAYKSHYFPFGALCLKCDFEIEIGGICSRIEYSTSSAIEDIDLDYSNKASASCCPLKVFATQLYADECLDVKLRVDDGIVRGHKSLLGARSSVFKDIFTSEMKEDILSMDTSDIKLNIFRLLLRYVCMDSIPNLKWNCALDLFKVTDKYKLIDLRNECFTFIKRNISEENFFDVIPLLYLHDKEHFQGAMKQFASNQGIEIVDSKLWNALIVENPREALRHMECVNVVDIFCFIYRVYIEVFALG